MDKWTDINPDREVALLTNWPAFGTLRESRTAGPAESSEKRGRAGLYRDIARCRWTCLNTPTTLQFTFLAYSDHRELISNRCTHKRTLACLWRQIERRTKGMKGKLLYMRGIGARIPLPRGSAVELIPKWSSQRGSRSPAAGVQKKEARCQRFHLLLIVLRLTSADNGSRAACPGRGESANDDPAPKESGAMMPSIPRLATHFRLISQPRCVLCISP